jgi:hypothetical protein
VSIIHGKVKKVAQATKTVDEFDSYRLRLGGYWTYATPSGTWQGTNETTGIDLQKDMGFNIYSTFVGKLDWKFTHKNHLYIAGNSSKEVVLDRTIVLQGQTFEAGLTVQGNLVSPMYAFGYQYDMKAWASGDRRPDERGSSV